MLSPRKIILDCDPGHDDAIAMMLALASPELSVLGVTTVYGNVGVDKTTRNALVVREVLQATVPVYRGADRPLVRDRISAEAVHGESGLDGPHLPEPTRSEEEFHAVRFIVDTVMANPGEVTLVPTGSLTNVALALRLEPRLAENVRGIVLMGGSVDLGNWTPAAEFNILCDPEAARIVFESGVKLTMFGLNATHQTPASPERVARLRALGTTVGAFTADLLDFFRGHHEERYGWNGAPIHDACVVAYLVRPDLFEMKSMYVEIDTTNGPSAGRTVCDFWRVTGKAPNADVAMNIDVNGFYDLLVERVGTYA
ncbi:nucleoside hydrolase [Deinococcus yavapaiensis]|uniref:nucleoside hydrolase n=1 Tax=Deinococcus yavapaiensis TaxID=309889 RepID=UPI000DA1F773|nr:nucleoside hydrolase [Deinococcus yavapaiensis]